MSTIYDLIKNGLEKFEFITIIGKYDYTLGPRALYSAYPIDDENFIRNLLQDALNTKSKFINLDYNQFYSQVCKIEIKELESRGGKQIYAIILLRDAAYPLIPTINLQKLEMMFHKIGDDNILADDQKSFERFFEDVNELYRRKAEVLPIEKFHLMLRAGINTIQGCCELVQLMMNEQDIPKDRINDYLKMMLDSCDEIMKALESESNESK